MPRSKKYKFMRVADGYPEPTVEEPDMDTLESWVTGAEICEATDGCMIEPDGVCQHGHPSWLIKLNIM